MKQSEIWLVDFSRRVGQEIDKVRPAIVVNHDTIGALQLKVVVPITDAAKSRPRLAFLFKPYLGKWLV